MAFWILATLGLFFLQTLIAPTLRFTQNGTESVRIALGGRDNPPEMPTIAGRIDRALKNMIEALLVFIPLSLLAIILQADENTAVLGAKIFFFARVFYVPAYVSGIPGLRTSIWTIGSIGQIMIVISVVDVL